MPLLIVFLFFLIPGFFLFPSFFINGAYAAEDIQLGNCTRTGGGGPSTNPMTFSACGAWLATNVHPSWGIGGNPANPWVTVVPGTFAMPNGGWRLPNAPGNPNSAAKWERLTACPAGTVFNPLTGSCDPDEALQCDEVAAVSFYPNSYVLETIPKPTSVQVGQATESFCSENCEVRRTWTYAVVSSTETDVTVSETHTAIVTQLHCDNIDPESENFVTDDHPLPPEEGEGAGDGEPGSGGSGGGEGEPGSGGSGGSGGASGGGGAGGTAGGSGGAGSGGTGGTGGQGGAGGVGGTGGTGGAGGAGGPGGAGGAGGAGGKGADAVCGGPGLPACQVKIAGNTGVPSNNCDVAPNGGGDELLNAILMQEWYAMCQGEGEGGGGPGSGGGGTGEGGPASESTLQQIAQTLENIATGPPFVAPGGEFFDLEAIAALGAAAKSAYETKLEEVQGEAADLFELDLDAEAVLPCTEFSVWGVTYPVCISDYAEALSPIGDFLVFLSFLAGTFLVLRK